MGSTERISNVAKRVAKWHRAGHQMVVVPSAMSGETNRLLGLAKELAPSLMSEAYHRELDMLASTGEQASSALLAIALQAIGIESISYAGWQVAIKTNSAFTKARIESIEDQKVLSDLNQGRVVIITGFQGVDEHGNITTLGRGGSDTSAVAVAAALKAKECLIYTDVDGVYTADPRIIPDAKKIQEISYDEMLEMAALGSKVMQARSVEFAKKFNVVFEVRSSFNNNPGTIVKTETSKMEDVVIRGVAVDKKQAKVTIAGVPDKPGIAAKVFKTIADANINIEVIVQNVSANGTTDISFTVGDTDAAKSVKVLQPVVKGIGAREVTATGEIAKLSVVGIGMRSHPGVAAKMFETLADNGINIGMISTSEIKISVIIALADAEKAARAVHAAFGLSGK